ERSEGTGSKGRHHAASAGRARLAACHRGAPLTEAVSTAGRVGVRAGPAAGGGRPVLGRVARALVRGSRVIAVDTNILVYAHRRDMDLHRAAAACLRTLAEGLAAWALPWPCLHEFLAIVTHRRIFAPPTSLDRAL